MSTDLAPAIAPEDTTSVVLDTPPTRNNDADFQNPEKPEPKPEKVLTARQAIEKAAADLKVADKDEEPPLKVEPKPEAKPEAKVEAKPEVAPKPAPEQKEPAEKSEGVERAAQEAERPKPSEGKGIEAPARFLPRAKEVWQNTPNPVKEEVHRALQEAEDTVSQAREAVDNWKQLEEFHKEAKSHGTTVPDYIRNVRAIEQELRTNPINGIARVLKTAGITPEQYANHILTQAQQRQANPALAQTEQVNQQVEQLTRQILEMKRREDERQEADRLNQVHERFITPFKAEQGHERYDELEPTIAQLLNSGIIPSNLSERQKLETAYDMAVRLNPSSGQRFEAPSPAPEAEATRVNPAGEKSIKGSPAPGTDPTARKNQKLNRRESIRAAAAELGIDF